MSWRIDILIGRRETTADGHWLVQALNNNAVLLLPPPPQSGTHCQLHMESRVMVLGDHTASIVIIHTLKSIPTHVNASTLNMGPIRIFVAVDIIVVPKITQSLFVCQASSQHSCLSFTGSNPRTKRSGCWHRLVQLSKDRCSFLTYSDWILPIISVPSSCICIHIPRNDRLNIAHEPRC